MRVRTTTSFASFVFASASAPAYSERGDRCRRRGNDFPPNDRK